MAKQEENVITSKVTVLLRKMTHGWTFEEQQTPFIESGGKPDIMAKRNGRETIAIEAKPAAVKIEKGIEDMREKYLGKTLDTGWLGVSDTLQVGLVIRYPQAATDAEGEDLESVLTQADDFTYRVMTASGEGNFPKTGAAKGSLRDIATALAIGASPTKQIRETADKMATAMQKAAERILQAIERKPAIGDELAEILGEDATEEACGKACLFIMNSFIYQNELAGKKGFEKVSPLSEYDGRKMEYRTVQNNWEAVLEINYVPIFESAVFIVDALRYDAQMAREVLKILLQNAIAIAESHLPQIHELVGEIFQELIVDRAYVKANYTLPESAMLLAALVCPDIDVNNLPKVADFACGTGALLNGVYKQIQRLYEQKTGRSSREIHRKMMQGHLGGVDIYAHATHLTFMAMASAHPDVTLKKTRVITAPSGAHPKGYLTGSLELLDDELLLPTLGIEGSEVRGDGDARVEMNQQFPHGEMDIVIMNPPFLKDGADVNKNTPKSSFEARGRSDTVRWGMHEALAQKSTEFSGGILKYSYFVELAHRKLRDGGRMGFILPVTALIGSGFQRVRKLWATGYHNVVVVTIAQNRGHDSAFSFDTDLAECIVIADKGVGENTGRAKFVSLNQRPQCLLTANKIAHHILMGKSTRQLEDIPHGGDMLELGDGSAAQFLNCPISGEEWSVSQTRSLSLWQTAYQLQRGELHLPLQPTSHQISMCRIGEIAVVGYNHRSIKDAKSGAFSVSETRNCSHEGYPAILHVEAEYQRAMLTQPNAELRMKISKKAQAERILARNSRTHYHMDLRFNSNSQLANWTDVPMIGVTSITNVQLEDSRYDAAWTLWTNSTLGLLCHWVTAGKQQMARGRLTLKRLPNVPTLDVRALSDEQLAAADRVFAGLKEIRMLPYNECASDAWRHVLDARLLAEVLGITDVATHAAMQKLRVMLCDEPSIAGAKKSVCDLEKERQKHDLVVSPGESVAALEVQQKRLEEWSERT